MKKERIDTILKKCKRNKCKPDLHSFTAEIKNGKVFVNYAESFNITVIKFAKDDDKREHYNLNLPKTIDLLEKFEINIDSVEF